MSKPTSNSRRAGEMYLQAIADGYRISMRACAERYHVSVGTVSAVVARLRRAGQAPSR